MTVDQVRKLAIDAIAEANVPEWAHDPEDAQTCAFYIEGIRTMCELVCNELEGERT